MAAREMDPVEKSSSEDSDDDCGCARVLYDRKSPGSAYPNDQQYFQSMADLAIDFYTKQNSEKEKYRVVELIRLVDIYLTHLHMTFTAKLNDGSDPKTFEALIIGTKVEWVRILGEGAI